MWRRNSGLSCILRLNDRSERGTGALSSTKPSADMNVGTAAVRLDLRYAPQAGTNTARMSGLLPSLAFVTRRTCRLPPNKQTVTVRERPNLDTPGGHGTRHSRSQIREGDIHTLQRDPQCLTIGESFHFLGDSSCQIMVFSVSALPYLGERNTLKYKWINFFCRRAPCVHGRYSITILGCVQRDIASDDPYSRLFYLTLIQLFCIYSGCSLPLHFGRRPCPFLGGTPFKG
jgi:hypothetical protein